MSSQPKGFISYSRPSLPPLDHIYAELAQVVNYLHRDGRSTRSAAIKPQLSQRLGVSFDEKSYGFSSFREFLHTARDAGAIDLRPAPTGPDVDVILPGQPPENASQGPVPIQIREDFWSTFMDWTPGFERAYDRDRGRAFRVPIAAESYDPSVRQIREQMQTNSARFVTIEPIDMTAQSQWARSFVADLPPGPEHDVLADALRATRPLQQFARKVREQPCFRAWTTFRNEQVVALIRDWATKNRLTIDPLVQPRGVNASATPRVAGEPTGFPSPAEQRTPPLGAARLAVPPRRAGTEVNISALRAHAHDLVDRMTVEELLALPLTLSTLYRR